jgi:hypothetical protein
MSSVRRVIYAPELCADACLLFSYTGASARSFRLRHHSAVGSVEIGPDHCADYVTTDWIRSRIRRQQKAEGKPFDEASFWSGRLIEYAESWIGSGPGEATFDPTHFPAFGCADRWASPTTASQSASRFPFLDLDLLLSSAKGRKPQDLERITASSNSEDYVTWALVCAWKRCRPEWWAAIVQLAAAQAPGLDTELFSSCVPEVKPWLRLTSPGTYEQLSRTRMAASSDPTLSARAADLRPVEGESEIDLTFISRAFVVFVEAKLGSDISLSTKYDPSRNQIVRSIDCALEHASGLPAAMWMFVRDTAPSRLYTSLIDDYRRDPRQLHRLLPHRSQDEVEAISSRLAVITWDALLGVLCLDADEAPVREVLDEVRRRLQL